MPGLDPGIHLRDRRCLKEWIAGSGPAMTKGNHVVQAVAGDLARAEALALHAVVIGAAAGLAFSAIFVAFGAPILRMLGGSGAVPIVAGSPDSGLLVMTPVPYPD
jgi:hypothetical protein